MDIYIKVIFPETQNAELVIEEHIQTRSNPKEGEWEWEQEAFSLLRHLQLYICRSVSWVLN